MIMFSRFRCAKLVHPPSFKSRIFPQQVVKMADVAEDVVQGGRDKFHLLPKGFEGVKKIGVIGWSSQGPAQAMNLRDSLAGTDIKVSVGLREGSSSMKKAELEGFSKAEGSLGNMWDVISDSDMVILLISDGAQAELYPKIFSSMKSGSILGLSHGFLLGHMRTVGDQFPSHLDVIAVCPKGMGPSVRRLYVQGKEVNGAGINCSFAVEQNVSGKAVERALAWGIGIGAPYIFQTSLEAEYRSDIYGERGVLLGAIHGIVEFLYRHFLQTGNITKEEAFKRSSECITGPVRETCSKEGLLAVYENMNDADKKKFEAAYSASYHPLMEILLEIYSEVESGREISSVIDHGKRFARYPMGRIETTETWQIGKEVRASRGSSPIPVDPTAAGVYLACMVSQSDVLLEQNHCYSEVANESIIEAVDSLSPYLHAKGIEHMIDNCSVTARLGARKWAPRFDYLLWQQAGHCLTDESKIDTNLIQSFKNHKLHDIMKVATTFRPPVDISPQS